MTKREALELFSNSPTKLANALGISRQAVHRWPDDGPIPELQELKLRHEIIPSIKKTA